MVLTKKEEEIVIKMINPCCWAGKEGESYESLSDDELDSLIERLDDYVKEIGEERRAFGIYDEFYIVQFLSVRSMLENEREKRKNIH